MHPQDFIGWLVAGVLAVVVVVKMAPALQRIWTVRIPERRHQQFVAELEADIAELIRARLHVAAMECQLAGRIGKMPANFDVALFLAARTGYQAEQAVKGYASRAGLVDPAILGDLANAEPLPGQASPPAEAPLSIAPQPLAARSTGFVWQNDRLVPS